MRTAARYALASVQLGAVLVGVVGGALFAVSWLAHEAAQAGLDALSRPSEDS